MLLFVVCVCVLLQEKMCKASTINTNDESLDRTETTVIYVKRQETDENKELETKGLSVCVRERMREIEHINRMMYIV